LLSYLWAFSFGVEIKKKGFLPLLSKNCVFLNCSIQKKGASTIKVRRKVNNRKGIRWLLDQDNEVKREFLKDQENLCCTLINEIMEVEVKIDTGI